MVNSELFRQIADRIEKEPESYDQRVTVQESKGCGTAYCIGGYALLLGGAPPECRALCEWRDGDICAQTLLGLSFSDANDLFDFKWQPRPSLTVPEALRLIADGKSVAEVSHG